MFRARRHLLLPTLFSILCALIELARPIAAHAADWPPVTPEELKMTSEPKAPGAPAIYLFRQVDRDDSVPKEYVYARIKIRSATKDADEIKPIETVLSHSLTMYRITKATVRNLHANNQPFQYNYSISVDNYAKLAGDLLLVRPRVLGTKSSCLLETKEPRQYPVNFERPGARHRRLRDRDSSEFPARRPARSSQRRLWLRKLSKQG